MAKKYMTDFVFFKNTPLTNFQDTIHFTSNAERDNFFLNGNHYPSITTTVNFNYISDMSTVRLSTKRNSSYFNFDGVNYCTFLTKTNGLPNDTRFYAFVVQTEYINDGCFDAYLVIDTVMTFTQGKVLNQLQNVHVIREHLSRGFYNSYLPQLRTNDDIIAVTTKKYVKQKQFIMTEYYIVFTCSADLESEYGTQDKPEFETSSGIVYDNIISPLNLYLINKNRFNELMDILKPYPWIAQNIKKVLQIPAEIIDTNNTTQCNIPNSSFTYLRKFITDRNSSKGWQVEELITPLSELYETHNLDQTQDAHLLRSEYTTLEIYSWDGQQMLLDPALLDSSTGLVIICLLCAGYHNEMAFFPKDYATTSSEENIHNTIDGEDYITMYKGQFLNNSITYSNFDEIPVLLDTYGLALANNANQRELAESKLLSNRVANVFDSSSDVKSRFFDAVSLLSNVSISGLGNRITDEYEYYRTQKAQNADLALQMPSVSNQSTGNSFQIANHFWGLTLKISSLDPIEWLKVKKYYKLMGYQIEESGTNLSDVESMTICNYVQFTGGWKIDNIDPNLVELLKVNFENGIRMWHNNGTPNPMSQDVTQNVIKG